jgi:hypothetical protein
MSATDLTRWNRAGLARLRYVDANAAVHYDLLRNALRAHFVHWPGGAPASRETEDRWRSRLEAQYTGPRGDWGEELARTLARACHLLTEYLDAYANESTLRTATQWDNVRRMVEMLDYHPAPPASAATPLVIAVKAGKRGRLAKSFAVKYAPTDGGAPVVFETLADLNVDDRLNELRLAGYDRSPEELTGSELLLDRRVAGLKLGEPIVLENERTRFTLARLIAGIQERDGRTLLRLNNEIKRAAGFTLGDTIVHTKPTDRLAPLGPAQRDAAAGLIGNALFLTAEPRTLNAGEVVYIGDGSHAYYRRAQAIDGKRVQLDRAIDGPLRLDQAYLSRARRASVAKVDSRVVNGGPTLFSFKAAGDLSAAALPPLIADVVAVAGGTQLEHFHVVTAKYRPPAPNDPASGYTTFTVEDPGHRLDNPQEVYLPTASREWDLDSYLYDSAGGLLPRTLLTTLPKGASTGDLAVVVSGERLGWARLANVVPDPGAGRAELTVSQWHTRASGRFHLSQTRIYSRFTQQVRLHAWGENATPVSDSTLVLAGSRPDVLVIGRRLWIEQQQRDAYTRGREATVIDLSEGAILIDPPLAADEGFTLGNTVIRGNVVTAGHGETKNERILGSGDAASLNQSFVLSVAGVSFVGDPAMPAGVRADIEVIVDGQRWQQVATLDDSVLGDAHYAVRMTEESFLRIEFGDGTRGRRLPSGVNNVRAGYRLGTGLAGNLPAGRLEKPARPHPLVDKLRQPSASSGGGDMESASALKRNAPASLLTLERAVSADDYAHLAAAHAAVWRARAFALPSMLRHPRIEVVVVPAGGGALDERLAATLQDFLVAHSLPGINIVVSEFGRVWLHLDITLRIVSAEYDPQVVKAQAIARLTDAFALKQRDIGTPLYLSDVYAVTETIQGVRNSSCGLAYDRGGARQPAAQRVDAGAREVVFLDPAARPGALRVALEEFEL